MWCDAISYKMQSVAEAKKITALFLLLGVTHGRKTPHVVE
jgi:hypothetical protein